MNRAAWIANSLKTIAVLIAGLLCVATRAAEPNELSLERPEFVLRTDLRSQMVADLMFLTSDELQGRNSIEPSILEAAEYIATRFREIGLDTDLFGDSPLQFLDISVGPQVKSADSNFLVASHSSPASSSPASSGPASSSDASSSDETQLSDLPSESTEQPTEQPAQTFELGRDFSPLAIGSEKASVAGELVWVGYGIRAPEHQYDDYEGLDVRGKIVMMLRKEPGADDPASPFEGSDNTRHAFFQTKVALAIDQGAVAVLLVNDPASVEKMLGEVRSRREAEQARLAKIRQQLKSLPEQAVNSREKLAAQIARIEAMLLAMDEQLETAQRGLIDITGAGLSATRGTLPWTDPETGQATTLPPVPVLSVSRQFASGVLGRPLSEIEAEIDSDYQPRSFALPGTSLRLAVELTPSTFRSPNVLGVLPGRGALAEETVVIGAHFDHVGMGGYGSLAPGTIAVHNGADDNASGTATMLRLAARMTQQLRGPDAPADHRRLLFIAFTGEERGLLGSKHYIEQPRFPLSSTVAMINMDMVGRLQDNELTVYGTGTAPSFSALLAETNRRSKFNLVEVPSGYGPSDHSSFNEAGIPVLFFFTGLHSDYHRPSDDFEKLNLDGMDRITDIISQVSERLVTMPERPVYAKTEANVQIRRQLTVFMGVKLSQQPSEVVLSSILAAGPAEESGLQPGDQLVEVGDKPIATVDDLMNRLRQCSPGDLLPVVVRRDGAELTLQVRLRPR